MQFQIKRLRRSGSHWLSIALALFVIGLIALPAPAAGQSKSPRSLAYYSKMLAEIALSVRDQYVEEIDVDALFEAGIEGMMEGLDPYSIALTRNNINLVQETATGKYEGIGVDIDVRDGDVTVIAPLEGSPAERLGLRAGDKIVAIDEVAVAGLKPHQINQMLRGSAGSSVKLSVMRPGTTIPVDYDLMRAVIEVHPVQYSGMIDNEVGYIRLSSFTEQTVSEFKSALRNLKTKGGMKSLIIDLRSNGGGLLDQAVGVVSQFLPKEKLVVSTHGRSAKVERRYFTDGSSLFTSGRMVVLVDSGTASASEIVAGSLQDWDRAVIMGQETFGKGLVQNVFEWPDHNIAVKMTTSRYYIPSGRLIQKPSKLRKRGVRLEAASRVVAKDTNPLPEKAYKTDGGRTVNGGGGISPDVVLHSEFQSELVNQLTRENLFFRFALEFNAKHKSVTRNLTVGNDVLSDFREFVRRDGFEFKTRLEAEVDRLQQIAEQQSSGSSLRGEIDELRKSIRRMSNAAFDEAGDEIALEIKREILRSQFDQDVVYEEVVLKNDQQIQAAVDLLKNKGRYQDLLKP